MQVAHRADLGAVMAHLVQRPGDEMERGAGRTRRAEHAQPALRRRWRIAVGSIFRLEPVVVCPLERATELLPTITQSGD
jgi:hypothetical protein